MKNSTPQQQVAHVIEQVIEQSHESERRDSERRAFLKTAAVAAGGLALGLQLSSRADDAAPPNTPANGETVVALPEKVLAGVGGFDVVDAGNDKVIVVRTDEKSVAACSAICTHRGCTLGYDAAAKQLACPCHGARFGLDGKVLRGPAKRDLKAYDARIALGLKDKA